MNYLIDNKVRIIPDAEGTYASIAEIAVTQTMVERVHRFRRTCLVQSNKAFSIAVAIVAFFLAYSFLLSLGPYMLRDADTFWHIRTGEWILDHAQLPTVDFYSYTQTGKPWISPEWLSEIFYAVAYKFDGWRAVTIVAVTACAAIIGILCFYLLQHLRFSVAIGLTVLTAVTISGHFVARPHVFSYVLLGIWMITLLDAYDDDNFSLPSLFILAPLMILWANLHGSFTFGLALLYVFASFCIYQNVVQKNYAKCWRLLFIASAVTVCALITPYGISPAFETIKLLDMKATLGSVIGEWRQPIFQLLSLNLIYLIIILAAIAGLGIRLRGPRLVVFSLITVLGLSHIRGLVMFFILVPIILARPAARCAWYLVPQLSGTKTSETDQASDPVLSFLQRRSFAILASCMAVAVLITGWTWWREDIVPSKAITPKAAIDFVQRTNIAGNVFNWYNFGGYLIFSGIPTFIDGRTELFGDDFLHKYSEAEKLADINSAFEMLDEYKVNWVVFPPEVPLMKALARSALWDEVYSDEYSAVFMRHR